MSAYGEGWVTGCKIKVKQKMKKKNQDGYLKIKLMDVGLLPGNYLELEK